MALLRSYAPSMGRSSRMCGPLPQQPLWLRQRAREGLYGDYRRQEKWGVLLCGRILASAATKPVLQQYARAQGRMFCSRNYLHKGCPAVGNVPTLDQLDNKLDAALRKMRRRSPSDMQMEEAEREMLEGLGFLNYYANKDYANKDKASQVVRSVTLLLEDLEKQGLHKVAEESLRVMCLLLENASDEAVLTKLWGEISREEVKTILERMAGADEVPKLAKKILAQLPSTPN